MNILLVDDNKELREALTKLLVQRGHMVTSAACGLHAMSAVHHAIDPYDAMLTDYTMPNMTGVELAQSVQKCSPSTRIAIMSGDASIASRIPAGISFLRKGSFGYDEIAQALHLQDCAPVFRRNSVIESAQESEAFRKRVLYLNSAIETALTEVGQIVLQGLPAKSGFTFHANDVRSILVKLVVDAREMP